jgi:hypothetical protein
LYYGKEGKKQRIKLITKEEIVRVARRKEIIAEKIEKESKNKFLVLSKEEKCIEEKLITKEEIVRVARRKEIIAEKMKKKVKINF